MAQSIFFLCFPPNSLLACGLLIKFQVTSDLIYLLNLAASSHCTNEEMEQALCRICHLVFSSDLMFYVSGLLLLLFCQFNFKGLEFLSFCDIFHVWEGVLLF